MLSNDAILRRMEDHRDWKQKLAAYLHDPPSKCLDIRSHGDRADQAFRQAGITDETEVGQYFRGADHTGAASDRLPFPRSQSANLTCVFDGVRNGFLHPLSGEKLPFHAEFKSQELVFDGEGSVQPVLSEESLTQLVTEDERWRARFFAHWRLWPKHAVEKDYRMALLPADTRIPDHSIWTHMQVVSALGGCAEGGQMKAAFLKFQLGPVQDFIAAARSVRDLWSGSYLLSWLMAAGMKALSAEVGPDSVIFPNLRGQPLFDLHWRDELWSKASIGEGSKTVWESLNWSDRDLLTPNLPNVFLAVVPAADAAQLAEKVSAAIKSEWKRVAESVWKHCEDAGLTAGEGDFTEAMRKERFNLQADGFLSLSWQVTEWPDTLEAALKLADGFADEMPIVEARKRVQVVVDMAEKQMPVEHRDGRYYVGGNDGPKEKLNNIGLGWSVILLLNSWELDAVRQTRDFTAANTGGWQVGTFMNKDALTGRDEAVAGGKAWGETARAKKEGPWKSLFKHDDWLSAPTLIKRVWHFAYLAQTPWGLRTSSKHFPMPDTRGIARHDPFGLDDAPENESAMEEDSSEKYFAVLAFDGDEIGKWVSGEKTPAFKTQLADYTDGSNVQRYGSKLYFEKSEFASFLDAQRPLSPSYHLQFSEALSNFALLCARPIVESFDGRLIYSGGDDVAALLPADTALACARALRTAFQGNAVKHPTKGLLYSSPAPGFLEHEKWKDDHGRGRPIPFLVPGPNSDCSVGIAIAHFKAPLQDVVRAAQAAEKRAKRDPADGGLGRGGVAVTLMKRSGEIIEWGAKWDGGLKLYQELSVALESAQLSAKFPHRFAELLEAYVAEITPLVKTQHSMKSAADFPVEDIVRREFDHCVSRQQGPKFGDDSQFLGRLDGALNDHLNSLVVSTERSGVVQPTTAQTLRSLIGLCQTVAFAHRTASDSNNNHWPKGSA